MRLKPSKDKVVVEPVIEKTELASGIIIPDSAKEKPLTGIVRAVGSNVTEVKVGDTVLFGKYSGTEIKVDEKNYLLVYADDLMGVME